VTNSRVSAAQHFPPKSITHFQQINRKTGHRLRQQMVDEVTGIAVEFTVARNATSGKSQCNSIRF
jgi:non-homologous end joining protein Ku